MKTSLQPTAFRNAVQFATNPVSSSLRPVDGKPAVFVTGTWIKVTEEGVPVYPTVHAHGKWRDRRRTNGLKQQKKLEAKVYELEKRLDALQASRSSKGN